MRRLPFRAPARRGSIAPLACVLSLFLVGMVAFAVDTSWIVLTQSELQNAADAAALAGANRLMDSYVAYNTPGQSSGAKAALLSAAIANAKTSAKAFAAQNTAGGVKSLALLDADIQPGFLDGSNKFTPYSGGSTTYPNTVQVTLRRDATANTALDLFFAPAIGTKSINLTANARATVYSGVINSVGTKGTLSMLPMTYDVNAWTNYVKTGQDPDGNASTDAKGAPALQIYPSVKQTGNFGELSLDDSHAGTSTIKGWIDNGLSSSTIQTLLDKNLIPLSAHDPTKWDWVGNPGLRASTIMEVNNFTGTTYLLPLFLPKDTNPASYTAGVGNGSHLSYNIVAFVPVTVMVAPQSNRSIMVQPAAYIDPNVTFDPASFTPAGSSSSFLATVTVPKLTN